MTPCMMPSIQVHLSRTCARYTDGAPSLTRSEPASWPGPQRPDFARRTSLAPPFVRHHVNMLGRYSVQLRDLPGVCARWASLGRMSFGSWVGRVL